MSWLERLRARWSADDDLAEEIAQHLEEKIQELVARGISRDGRVVAGPPRARQHHAGQGAEPRRLAVRRDRATCWIRRPLRMPLSPARQDVRCRVDHDDGARRSAPTPPSSASSTPCSFVRCHFPDSDRLVSVQSRDIRGTPHPTSLSYPTFFDFRRSNRVFEHMVSYRDEAFTLTDRVPAARVPGEIVSWDFFSALGVAPALGRGFRRRRGTAWNARRRPQPRAVDRPTSARTRATSAGPSQSTGNRMRLSASRRAVSGSLSCDGRSCGSRSRGTRLQEADSRH